jgi:hypothetical protein
MLVVGAIKKPGVGINGKIPELTTECHPIHLEVRIK